MVQKILDQLRYGGEDNNMTKDNQIIPEFHNYLERLRAIDPKATPELAEKCMSFHFGGAELILLERARKINGAPLDKIVRSFERGVILRRMKQFLSLQAIVPGFKPEQFMTITRLGMADDALVIGEIIRYHNIKVNTMIDLCEEHRSVDRIMEVMAVREQYQDQMSIRLSGSLVESIDFHVESNDEIFSAFEQVAAQHQSMFPWHIIEHVIEIHFGGDILLAYHYALDDPTEFWHLCRPSWQRRSDYSDEERHAAEIATEWGDERYG
jgi:hypothetical protein